MWWSESKTEISRSLLTPFAVSSLSMTAIRPYCFPAAALCPVARYRSPRNETYCGSGILLTASPSVVSGLQVALGSLNASERVEREGVARVGPERGAILSAGGRDAADLPVDLAELHVRPGLRLGLTERRV